jgi:hypothetical protein
MTSPALFTKTVSFTLISSLFSSSKLCKVTFDILAPDIKTGSIVAYGVTIPVRPTENRISVTFEYFSEAGNFQAVAHLGAFETKPNLFC